MHLACMRCEDWVGIHEIDPLEALRYTTMFREEADYLRDKDQLEVNSFMQDQLGTKLKVS
jgi:hypothetical protein